MEEALVYDEVSKMWMTQATLDELKKKREEQEASNEQ